MKFNRGVQMTIPPMAKAARPALERLLNGRVHGHVVLLREVQANVLPEHAVDPDGYHINLRCAEAIISRDTFQKLGDDYVGVLQRVVSRAYRRPPQPGCWGGPVKRGTPRRWNLSVSRGTK